jgi:hypothetical protein
VDAYLSSNSAELGTFNGDIAGLRNDLWNIYLTAEVFVENLGSDEDITREFNEFIADLLGIPEGSPENVIEAAVNSYDGEDLVGFINGKLL